MKVFSITCKEDITNYLSQKIKDLYCGLKCDLTQNGSFRCINNLTGKYRIIDAEIIFSEEQVHYYNGGGYFDTYQIRLQVETIKQGRKRWVNFNL